MRCIVAPVALVAFVSLLGCEPSPGRGAFPEPSAATPSSASASPSSSAAPAPGPTTSAAIAPDAAGPAGAAGAGPAAATKGAPSSASERDAVIAADLVALHAAGDRNACDPEVLRIRAALASDTGFTPAHLEAERASRDVKHKGPMPYPSPGTACAIFGIVRALEGALEDRRRAPP